ncbi:MAG: hypothetical protein LBD99_06760 [Candidatus Margulisbacteria bacterium]|jgi:hypothetical protein|nr:hypothetical protein [Candidatus Margulisiibacteriota bacterium]
MLTKIFQLINQDKSVLYPAMIAHFLLAWAGQRWLPQNGYGALALLGLSGLLNLFVHLFTAECARQIVLRPALLFGQALGLSVKRYVPAFIFSGLLAALFLLVGLFFRRLGWFSWLGLPALLTLGFALEIFPLVYVLSGVSAPRIYYLIYLYFCREPRRSVQLFSFFISLSILVNIGAAFLDKYLPVSLAAVATPLFGGFGMVFNIYGLALLLLSGHRINELV